MSFDAEVVEVIETVDLPLALCPSVGLLECYSPLRHFRASHGLIPAWLGWASGDRTSLAYGQLSG